VHSCEKKLAASEARVSGDCPVPGESVGATPEAAVHEIGDATLAWIAACRASGEPIPEPATKFHQAA
jgi:hypothetical protein